MEHARSERCETAQEEADFCACFEGFLLSRITSGEWMILVAEINDQLAGCVYLQKITKLPRPGRLKGEFGSITSLFVRKQHRGQGLRAQLLREIARLARLEGLEHLFAFPKTESCSVYRLAGFHQVASQMELSLE